MVPIGTTRALSVNKFISQISVNVCPKLLIIKVWVCTVIIQIFRGHRYILRIRNNCESLQFVFSSRDAAQAQVRWGALLYTYLA